MISLILKSDAGSTQQTIRIVQTRHPDFRNNFM
jgi:hypothetical protein